MLQSITAVRNKNTKNKALICSLNNRKSLLLFWRHIGTEVFKHLIKIIHLYEVFKLKNLNYLPSSENTHKFLPPLHSMIAFSKGTQGVRLGGQIFRFIYVLNSSEDRSIEVNITTFSFLIFRY